MRHSSQSDTSDFATIDALKHILTPSIAEQAQLELASTIEAVLRTAAGINRRASNTGSSTARRVSCAAACLAGTVAVEFPGRLQVGSWSFSWSFSFSWSCLPANNRVR